MARLLRYIHPHVSRYAQVDVPCRNTIIRRNRVALFLTVTLNDFESSFAVQGAVESFDFALLYHSQSAGDEPGNINEYDCSDSRKNSRGDD